MLCPTHDKDTGVVVYHGYDDGGKAKNNRAFFGGFFVF
jgi:hypothetical protein